MANQLTLTIAINADENSTCPSALHLQCLEAATRGSDYSAAVHVTVIIRYFRTNTTQCLQLDLPSLESIRALFQTTTKLVVKLEMHLRAVDEIDNDDVVLTVKIRGGLSLSQELVNAVARYSSPQNLLALKGMQKLVWELMENGFANVVVPWL